MKIIPYLFKTLLPFFIVLSLTLHSKPPSRGIGSRSSALGYCNITLSDFWSQFNNQAGMTELMKISVGLNYYIPFQIKALSEKSVGIILPIQSSRFAFNIVQYGDVSLNQRNIGIAYARKLGSRFSIGFQFNYFSINQGSDLGNIRKINFEGGFIFKIDSQLKIGAHVYNPSFHSNSNSNVKLPEIYRLGIEYKVMDAFKTYLEIKHHQYFENSFHIGMEYESSFYALRIGYSSSPDQLAFGIGLFYKHLHLNLSNNLHQTLGSSTQISMVYQF